MNTREMRRLVDWPDKPSEVANHPLHDLNALLKVAIGARLWRFVCCWCLKAFMFGEFLVF